jgi:CheY-like chemotaxis protein
MQKPLQSMLKPALIPFLKSLPIAGKACYGLFREGWNMATHFATVPVDAGPYQALLQPQNELRPVALVVDDEPIITETLAAILNGVGFAALTAFDGGSALETALLIPPQILITDLAMPGLDGLDLAVMVTRAVPDCEVILFSGHASICELAERMRSLACDFAALLKPVHPADMIDCICERLARRGCRVVPPAGYRSPSFDRLASAEGSSYATSWSRSTRPRLRSSTAMA